METTCKRICGSRLCFVVGAAASCRLVELACGATVEPFLLRLSVERDMRESQSAAREVVTTLITASETSRRSAMTVRNRSCSRNERVASSESLQVTWLSASAHLSRPEKVPRGGTHCCFVKKMPWRAMKAALNRSASSPSGSPPSGADHRATALLNVMRKLAFAVAKGERTHSAR